MQSDIGRYSGSDIAHRSRSRLSTALVATAIVTMLLVAVQSRMPAWALMAGAGLLVGFVHAIERRPDLSAIGAASMSGTAAGGVAGVTMVLCPLFGPDTLMSIPLVPLVLLVGVMGTYGCLCGFAGGLVAGLMVRQWGQRLGSSEEAVNDRRVLETGSPPPTGQRTLPDTANTGQPQGPPSADQHRADG